MEDNEYELLSSEPDQLPTYSVVPEDKIFQFKVVRGEMENKFKLKLRTGQTLPHTSNAKCKGERRARRARGHRRARIC